ncbi:hypothetical protein F4820DRAFT_33970 [Hypoxylon rubiginosum]|uniref:Uncharacterized protein n=1 Tax=Hypoxylon rubiginosum TaxID=110542 RepID=A0ACB9YSR8_9PEZI|nr:hypothetical protein F4820DRAFT_33970 [Hypoxylon rubiginosum]
MARDCPFCDDWAMILEQRINPKEKGVDIGTTQNVSVSTRKFKRHVATHQEQLAIFVLPRSSDPDGDEKVGSDETDTPSLTSFENNHDESGLREDNSDVDTISRSVEPTSNAAVEELLREEVAEFGTEILSSTSQHNEISGITYETTLTEPGRNVENTLEKGDITGNEKSDFVKKGKTRIPLRLVSKRAIIDLGYTFVEEVHPDATSSNAYIPSS